MFDHICLFQSKVFVPLFDDHGAFLVAYEHKNDSKQYFRELFRLKIPLKSFFRSKEILLDIADNYVLGVKCIVIVVFGHSNDFHVFFCCNTIKSNMLEVQYFIRSSEIHNPIGSIYLSHGPTLLTFLNGTFDVYTLSHRTKSALYLQSQFPAKHIKVLQVICIGQITKENPLNTMLLIVSGETSTEQDLGIFVLGIHFEDETAPVVCEKLCISTFFPAFLKNHAKVVEISNLSVSDQSVSEIKDIDWKDNYSILCTERKCFIHHKGEMMYSISLPLQDVLFVKTEFFFSLDNLSIILSSSKKEVCLLKPVKSSNELQLRKSWTNIQSILIGDILMNCSRQMMLVRNSHFESWQDDYILSDISNFMPVDILDQPAIPDECLKTTLSGLHAKFQAGKLAVSQKEDEIREKMEATLYALNRLNDTATENTGNCDISSFQDSLIDIILHKDENCKTEMNKRKDKQMLKFLNHWVKFINSNWFLCLTFLNEDKRAICNPTLQIIIQDQPMQCVQKVFLHSSSSLSLDDKCSKQINPQQNFSVLSALEFPSFFSENIKANAILSWYAGSSDEFENELFLPLEEKCLVQKQYSLTIDLKTRDIFHNVKQDVPTIEDLFCMKVLQQKLVFKVCSLHSSLDKLDMKLLSSEFSSLWLFTFMKNSNSVLFVKNKSSPLHGTHFMFKYAEESASEMEAFIKNDEELLLLLQFLQRCLPDDVIFIPAGTTATEITQMKQKMVCAMKEETDLLVSAFNAHNISAQIQGYSDLPVKAGTIVIPKKTFLRIRRALVKKECMTDSILKNICCTLMQNEEI